MFATINILFGENAIHKGKTRYVWEFFFFFFTCIYVVLLPIMRFSTWFCHICNFFSFFTNKDDERHFCGVRIPCCMSIIPEWSSILLKYQSHIISCKHIQSTYLYKKNKWTMLNVRFNEIDFDEFWVGTGEDLLKLLTFN